MSSRVVGNDFLADDLPKSKSKLSLKMDLSGVSLVVVVVVLGFLVVVAVVVVGFLVVVLVVDGNSG